MKEERKKARGTGWREQLDGSEGPHEKKNKKKGRKGEQDLVAWRETAMTRSRREGMSTSCVSGVRSALSLFMPLRFLLALHMSGCNTARRFFASSRAFWSSLKGTVNPDEICSVT
eukprot:2517887-Rhodomonas_salina.2